MGSNTKSLSFLLRQLRDERKMSLRDFSEILGISHAYLYKLEKGVDSRTQKPIMPTMDILITISDGLGIPIEEFLQMCGYIDYDVLRMAEPSYIDSLDVFDELQNILIRMSVARKVLYNEKLLETKDIDLIEENLNELMQNLLERYN